MSVAGAIAAAVGSLVAPSVLNYASSKNLASDEYDRQKEMWSMTNEYNSPKNVVARLKDAGLNPNLATGQLTGGLATQSPVPTGTRNITADGNFAGSLLSSSERKKIDKEINDLMDRQRDLLDTERAKVSADINVIQEEARGRRIANDVAQHDADIIMGSSSVSTTPQSEIDFKTNYPRLYKWRPMIKAGTQVASTAAQAAGVGGLLFKVGRMSSKLGNSVGRYNPSTMSYTY